MPLARAEFNLTARFDDANTIRIMHVEVNGTRVDFYPGTLYIGSGETVVVKVYFAYHYGTKYEFKFVDDAGNVFSIISTSPSDGGSLTPLNVV